MIAKLEWTQGNAQQNIEQLKLIKMKTYVQADNHLNKFFNW